MTRSSSPPWRSYLNGPEGRDRFRREQLFLPDGRSVAEGLERDPWIRDGILSAIDDPLCQLFSCDGTRGTAKTTTTAEVAIERLVLRANHDVLIFALDRDQASILFREAAAFVRRSPDLGKILDVQRSAIVNHRNHSRLEVLASDGASNYGFGLRSFTACIDEFCHFPNRDLFDALWSAAPKSAGSQVIILQNAGPTKECTAWEVREMCRTSTDPALRFFSTAAANVRPSWISEEEIERQRRTLPKSVFARLWLGEWGHGEGQFLTREEVESCIDESLSSTSLGFHRARRHYVGLDLGLKHDRAVLVVGHRERETFVVDHIRTWFGTPDRPVSLEEVQSYLHEIGRRVPHLRRALVDPWQAAMLIERAKRAGLHNVDEFTFTSQNLQLLSHSLWNSFRSKTIRIPAHTLLTQELIEARIVEKRYGWRLDHASGGYSDHAIALGLALVAAIPDSGEEVSDDPSLNWLIEKLLDQVDDPRRFGFGRRGGRTVVDMEALGAPHLRNILANVRMLQLLVKTDRMSVVEANAILDEEKRAYWKRPADYAAIFIDDEQTNQFYGASVRHLFDHGFQERKHTTKEKEDAA